jgi:hypothetical protein
MGAGKLPGKGGVLFVKSYEVRVFVPKVYLIEAKDAADVLEKIGELYKELYAKDFRTWIEELPLPEPEYVQ